MMEKIIFKNSKGQNLVGNLFLPEGGGKFPAAIFVHGYRSDKNSSKAKILSGVLPEKGIALFVIDLSGRGESEGKFEDTTVTQYIDDLKCAIDFLTSKEQIDSGRIAVIGSSLGGLVSLQEAAKDDRIKLLVLISPVSYFPYREKGEYSPEKIKKWKEKGHMFTESKRFGKMKINYSFYEDGTKYRDYSVYDNIKIPVVVIHGTEDESVSIEFSQKLVEHLKGANLAVVEGADHNYSKQEDCDKMINETVKFLEVHLK